MDGGEQNNCIKVQEDAEEIVVQSVVRDVREAVVGWTTLVGWMRMERNWRNKANNQVNLRTRI